jgi:hypothetical protein
MQDVVNSLNALRYNVKAETVISNLLANGFNPDHILIDFKSSHKKNWDNDILSSDFNGQDLTLKLSRDGLFNTLPEYLFLLSMDNREYRVESVQEFNQMQEDNTRLFFHPLENEIFNQLVALESQENQILYDLATYAFRNLNNFWKIDTRIGMRNYARLSKVMPFLHSIVGNFKLTAKCLEFLLEENVEWKMEERIVHVNFIRDEVIKPLNQCECGDNMFTCGDYTVTVSMVVFTIGPIAGSEIVEFLPAGNKRNLINIFQNYFIPMEVESDYIFNVSEANQDFYMDQSFLGFNTTIN